MFCPYADFPTVLWDGRNQKKQEQKKKKKREIQRAPAQIFHLYNGCYRDLIENIKL